MLHLVQATVTQLTLDRPLSLVTKQSRTLAQVLRLSRISHKLI